MTRFRTCVSSLCGLGLALALPSAAAEPDCHDPTEKSVASRASPLIPGEFELVDVDTGLAATKRTYEGYVRVVFFGFTHCTTVCPIGLANLGRTLDELGEDRTDVRALFITTDPERDSAETMAAYISVFAEDIVGLRGTDEQLGAASRAFRTEAVKVDIASDQVYQMDHPAIFYLMDRQGDFVRTLSSSGDPKELAAQIRAVLNPPVL